MKSQLTIWFSIFIVYLANGQCDCSELLKYGIFNRFNESNNVADYSLIQQEVSNSLKEQSSTSNGGEVGYKKIFNAKLNKSEAELMERISSSASLNETETKAISNSSASFISPDMLTAYNECLTLCDKGGLRFKASFPTDRRMFSITVDLKYKRPDNVLRDPIVQGIYIAPKGCYECEGLLVDMASRNDTIKQGTTYTIRCTRNISDTSFKLSGTGKLVTATDAHIRIETDLGNYEFRVPPLLADNPEFKKGVGEIIASMLTEEKFLETYGKKDWRLANGDDAPRDSEYFRYIDKYQPHLNGKLPDLRGRFLRGFNNEAIVNPDNNPLGSIQEDAFQGHNHTNKTTYMENAGGNGADGLGFGSAKRTYNRFNQGTHEVSGFGIPRVATETRPKNVTVNYFIRIN